MIEKSLEETKEELIEYEEELRHKEQIIQQKDMIIEEQDKQLTNTGYQYDVVFEDGERYVGQTKRTNPEDRFKQHMSTADLVKIPGLSSVMHHILTKKDE